MATLSMVTLAKNWLEQEECVVKLETEIACLQCQLERARRQLLTAESALGRCVGVNVPKRVIKVDDTIVVVISNISRGQSDVCRIPIDRKP